MMLDEDHQDEIEDLEQLLIYPTVKRERFGIDCFAVPPEAQMTAELLAYNPSVAEDNELCARWCDRIDEGFAMGEKLALETMAIAARQKHDGNWGLGELLRTAVEAEQEPSLEFVARGFIHTIVAAAISGRASLAQRRNAYAKERPPTTKN